MSLQIVDNRPQLNLTSQSSNMTLGGVVQELAIQQTSSSLAVNDFRQTLAIVADSHVLDMTKKTLQVDLVPNSLNINQYYNAGNLSFSVSAGETLGGHRAVYVANGEAFYADPANTAIPGQTIGITTQAATAGSSIIVQYTGPMEEAGWEFTPGPVYIGANGTLVQTRPASGWVINIGVAITATKLLINKSMSIEVI